MKKASERVKVEDEKFVMKSDIKFDNRGRAEVFEVKHNGVTLEWSANITDAIAAQKQTLNSQIFVINMNTGARTLRV